MADREKVIKGLEEAMDWLSTETSMTVVDQWVVRDAIALLKAQEPRVMTLEEVKAAAEHDVWIELSGNYADDVLFAATIEGCGTKGLCTRYESHNYSAYGIKPYGWRCWTSRPTDEQREATPWTS